MRQCVICGGENKNKLLKTCSSVCHSEHKRQRKLLKERKEAIKSRRDWENDLQTVFNAYIRERDRDLGCVSCGRHFGTNYHAGHFRSRGSSNALRFHWANVNGQCKQCNTDLSGNLLRYRSGLRERYGDEIVEYLDNNRDSYRWTIEECKELIEYYKQALKDLKNAK